MAREEMINIAYKRCHDRYNPNALIFRAHVLAMVVPLITTMFKQRLINAPSLLVSSPQESMKFSADQEMLSDWFTDRDIKVPHVILNDKLMSDAIVGGMPIKTEHSYSLNSDGDSMAYSPDSLHKQIDGKYST